MLLLNPENGLQVTDPLTVIFLQGTLPQGYPQPFCVPKPP